MKTFINCVLLFLFPTQIYSQTIHGIVLDSQTRDTITFASVYFNGTFIGTHTNEHGRFALELSGNKFMPLTISAIGYYSVTISEFPKQAVVKVYLDPKVYEMSEVVVTAESLLKERENNMRIFKREFLGSSIYGKNCVLLNEKDITFNYGKDADTLRAYASNLLRIHNPLLGYKIACFLDEFNYCRKTADVFFTGFILFEHDLIDSSSLKRILKRRRHAYLGSPMHFFRSLWADNLHKDKYGAYAGYDYLKGKGLYKKIVLETDSIKYLQFPISIDISYGGNITQLIFLSNRVAFNEDGQYDFTKIRLKGKMGKLRMGDWLPLEYKP